HRREGTWAIDAFELPAEGLRLVRTSGGPWTLERPGDARPRATAAAASTAFVVHIGPPAQAAFVGGPTILIPEVAAAERMPTGASTITIHVSPTQGIWV